MKRICIAVLFFIILLSYNVFSQRVGIKAGYGLSDIENAPTTNKDKPVFNAGVSFSYGMLTHVQAELNYRQKGLTQKAHPSNYDLDLNYINLPVLVGIDIFFLYLNAGPYLGILTSAKADGADIKKNFKTKDWGIEYGGGVRLPVTSELWFELDGRICQGMYNIDATKSDNELKNKSWSISLGLIYTLSLRN